MRTALLLTFLLAPLSLGKDPTPAAKLPKPVTKRQTVAGLTYDLTAGFLDLVTDHKQPKAHVFSVAYSLVGDHDRSRRPVTYVFNGGPGASSVWLHLGMLGPRRVAMDDDGRPLPPPGRLADNPDTWLKWTDLVFIDPVGTGFSRPAKGHKQKEFSGLKEDTDSVGEFIRAWTTRNKRWSSPKFLCGESYGTTRAASLADHLQRRYGMYLNGIVLVSAVLNFQTIRFSTGNDLPHALFLPGYCATAWYHRRLGPELQKDLQKTLRACEKFTLDKYVPALAKGDALPDEQRREIIEGIAHFTGLSPAYIDQNNLRIRTGRFNKELLRARRRTVGRLDSRYLGIDKDAAGSGYDYDPAMAAINGPFSAAIKDYLRREIGFAEEEMVYETLSGRVHPWSFKSHENRYVNVAENLRRAMTRNRNLKILVCAGYYDLATPYFAAEYTVRHLGLDPSLRGNIRMAYYEAGHMMYVRKPSREKMRADAAAFYEWCLKGRPPPG